MSRVYVLPVFQLLVTMPCFFRVVDASAMSSVLSLNARCSARRPHSSATAYFQPYGWLSSAYRLISRAFAVSPPLSTRHSIASAPLVKSVILFIMAKRKHDR